MIETVELVAPTSETDQQTITQEDIYKRLEKIVQQFQESLIQTANQLLTQRENQ